MNTWTGHGKPVRGGNGERRWEASDRCASPESAVLGDVTGRYYKVDHVTYVTPLAGRSRPGTALSSMVLRFKLLLRHTPYLVYSASVT